MKIRNGFVSNSSSSSFIIAVQEPEKCPHCGQTSADFLKILRAKFGDKQEHAFSSWSIKDYLKHQEEDIKELEKDNEWVEGQKKKYEDLLKDEKSLDVIREFRDLMNSMMQHVEMSGGVKSPRYKRWDSERKNSAREIISEELRGLSMYGVNKSLEEKREVVKKIKELNLNKKWNIFDIKNIDNWDTNLIGTLEIFLESDDVQLIRKETT